MIEKVKDAVLAGCDRLKEAIEYTHQRVVDSGLDPESPEGKQLGIETLSEWMDKQENPREVAMMLQAVHDSAAMLSTAMMLTEMQKRGVELHIVDIAHLSEELGLDRSKMS